MFVRRLPAIALLACLPLVLANCSSDSSGTPGGAGSTSTAGQAGVVGVAGQANVAGSGTAGSAPIAGAGNTAGASAGAAPIAGSSSGGASGGSGGASGGTTSGGSGGGSSAGAAGKAGGGSGGGSTGGSFTLTSPDQAEGAHFSKDFTCDAMNGTFGAGVNPELDWAGVPAGTKSFVLTFIDTKIGEANAMGQHWAAWDIPATAMKLPKGTTMLTGDLAGGKQSNKYLAPCPSGDDTYEFALYALSTATLGVSGAEGTGTSNSPGVAKVIAALKTVTPLGKATLHGTSSAKGK